MDGYFITREQANELGLLEKPNINSILQKVIIVVTEKDTSEYQIALRKNSLELSDKKIEEMADWFYKNYYNDLMNTFISFIEKPTI